MRISDWSSDVCSSDLSAGMVVTRAMVRDRFEPQEMAKILSATVAVMGIAPIIAPTLGGLIFRSFGWQAIFYRSEEHTSELQSLMRISYAVFCLKKKIVVK